jgi:hypothetical protein
LDLRPERTERHNQRLAIESGLKTGSDRSGTDGNFRNCGPQNRVGQIRRSWKLPKLCQTDSVQFPMPPFFWPPHRTPQPTEPLLLLLHELLAAKRPPRVCRCSKIRNSSLTIFLAQHLARHLCCALVSPEVPVEERRPLARRALDVQRRAGPSVIRCICNHPSPHGIPLHITDRRPQVGPVQDATEVAILPEMADAPAPRVHALRITALQVAEELRKRILSPEHDWSSNTTPGSERQPAEAGNSPG